MLVLAPPCGYVALGVIRSVFKQRHVHTHIVLPFTGHSPNVCTGQDWPMADLGAGIPVQLFYMIVMAQLYGPLASAFQGTNWQEAGVRS